jgi:DNA-binding MarR family transcriptional regulator
MSKQLEEVALSIKRVQARHHRTLDRRLNPVGVSLVQWNALREIGRNPGASAHALAELTFNSDQAFGTLATRLIRQGFVIREPGKGRAVVHRLTPNGAKKRDAGQVILLEVLKRSFAPLTAAERQQLQTLLTKLLSSPAAPAHTALAEDRQSG